MSIEQVRANLLALEESHRDDHDGGYLLATAFCDYRARMSKESVGEWDRVLLQWVADEKVLLWGVALEALAKAGEPQVNEQLAAMLEDRQLSTESRDYIAHSLLRRGIVNDSLRAHVEQSARLMRPMGLSNLAALLIIRPDEVKTAAECIAAALSTGDIDYIEANIPPFIYAAADSGPELLIRLCCELSNHRTTYAAKFAALVLDYANKPFVQRRLGAEAVAKLSNALGKSSRDLSTT